MTEKNIDITKLKQGNRVLLETKECIFDILVISPEQGTISISGGRRFLLPTDATLVGVYGRRKVDDEDRLLSKLQIEKNLGIEIHYVSNGVSSDFVTSPVLSAKVYTDAWAFEMWEDKDRLNRLSEALNEAKARIRIKTPLKTEEDTDENTLS